MTTSPDEIFANPRLAAIYDAMDSDRSDLEPYVAMVDEFGARSVLDVGCGTGTLACMLVAEAVQVIGVDPAAASIDVAKTKPGADRVQWIHGDATTLPDITVDMATMTANVAQVFLDEEYWRATLAGIRGALADDGHLVFEVRDPARRAWEQWNREQSWSVREVPGVGSVESWVEVTDVSLPLVSFRHTYRFASDGAELVSDSTLRFRDREEVTAGVAAEGFGVVDVRDAPDRPGKEFVFVCQR
jgi:SAM-dependent methyltransferase